MDSVTLISALQVLGPMLGVFIGIKASLNGTVARVVRIEEKIDAVNETQHMHGERLARLEERSHPSSPSGT